jgi:acyl-CoA dehydrogenase
MSQTEREALEAGTVWWDADLFSGRPRWERLLAIPPARLTPQEQTFLDGPVENLCRLVDDWKIHNEWRDLPPEVWAFLREKGFFGMIIPKKYGGLEFSALAHSSVVMKISSRSCPAAVTVMVPNSLGPAELLLHYGTEEQKDYYLPRLARGEEIPCFALTNPEAGSDAGSIPDSGVVCRGEFQGQKDVLGIRLNWEKRYITLGPVATLVGLAFRLSDPERLLGDREEIGITLALIRPDTPGIAIGNRHDPLGVPFQNGPNFGRDVFIPMDWVIGGAARVGQGWRMLMECLAAGRAISLPALSTGSSKLCCHVTGAYARVRRQFKMPIGRFEGVEEALARMAGYTYMMDAARTLTAKAVDMGEKPSVISAIVKYHLTEHMRQVVNHAMDIHGGSGISMGPRNLIGRIYQAVPISITVEGANILTRSLIIYGQGAIRCHPFVLKEIETLGEKDPDQALKKFDALLARHIVFFIRNLGRGLWMGLTGGHGTVVPVEGPLKTYYQQLTRMSTAFVLISDLAMLIVGGALKRKEKLSARLGDILSHLYLASASLKRFEEQGRPEADLPLVQWVCEHALARIQEAMGGVLDNFPNRPIAWFLRRVIFPWGRTYSEPSDTLGHRVADLILQPSEARERLTDGIFKPSDSHEAMGRLIDAFHKVADAERVEEKLIRMARDQRLTARDPEALAAEGVKRGAITLEEADLLQAAALARREAIRVDDFPSKNP